MVIRPVTEEDLEQIVVMAATFIKESSYRYSVSVPHIVRTATQLIAHPRAAIVGGFDECILGLWSGVIEYEWVPEPALYVSKFYIMPDARGVGVANALMESLKGWGKDNEVVDIFVTATGQVDSHFAKLCKKHGFINIGPTMLWENS